MYSHSLQYFLPFYSNFNLILLLQSLEAFIMKSKKAISKISQKVDNPRQKLRLALCKNTSRFFSDSGSPLKNYNTPQMKEHVSQYLSSWEDRKQLPLQHIQQFMFLIEYCERNDYIISNAYEYSRAQLQDLSMFWLNFRYIQQNLDMNKFVSFNNWNHIISLSYRQCKWFDDIDWKILAKSANNFKNLRYLDLCQTKITVISQGEVQQFSQLKWINLCSNALTEDSFKVLSNLRKNKPNTKILTYHYNRAQMKHAIRLQPQTEALFKSISSRLDSKKWKLQKGIYKRQRWDLLLKYVKEAEIEQIDLNQNGFQSIPKHVIDIRWYYLSILSLNDNQIRNIESLSFINMPFIQKIYLGSNKITVFSALNKLNWPNLQQYRIRQNCPLQIKQINRIKTSKKTEFFYETYNDDISITLQDKTVIVKCQLQEISQLVIHDDFGKRRAKQMSVLERRFPKARISIYDIK